MAEVLSIFAGATARQRLAREGWHPQLFNTLLGASGGPKLLGIAGLDRYLFSEFLPRSSEPMHLVGSSIGSWRHAALCQDDPIAALEILHHGYIHQHYEQFPPTPEQISEVSVALIDKFLGPGGAETICNHERFRSHVVTARGRGAAGSRIAAAQALGLGLAAIANGVHRKSLQLWFQRVVFSSHGDAGLGFRFEDFDTLHAPLRPANTRAALHASGSIPFILTGERDIVEAPMGQYWDGGIVDYHFDLRDYRGDDLVLYPHFGPDVIPGWFDKFLSWRGTHASAMDKVVLLCPSPEFLASLPHGKIPDRNDFKAMEEQDRIDYWEHCRDHSEVLGEAFAAVVEASDPLARVQPFS